jgi:hypothetical protein
MPNYTHVVQMASVVDPFCEKRFWADDQHKTPLISNPVSAVTGLVIMVMATFTQNIRNPTKQPIHATSVTSFYLCRASLGIVGAGTIVFHSIDDTQAQYSNFNFRMCDWVPIVLMCTNILVLYFTRFEKDACECTLTTTFVTMYLWTCVLVLAVDSTTYDYLTIQLANSDTDGEDSQNIYGTIMNVVLLVPLGLTLAYASVFKFERWQNVWVWGMIALNLVLWVCNAYLCASNLWMSMFHAAYHATIAYTFLLAACLGMTLDDSWELAPFWKVWPMIQMKPLPPPESSKDEKNALAENKNQGTHSLFHVKIEPLKFA